MSDARATIIAAVITSVTAIAAVLITTICNLRYNERQRNRETKERFFYEMYQRRLALYDDVIKTLYVMGNPERKNLEMSFRDFASKVLNDYYTLTTLINRLGLFGSQKTKKLLNTARTHLKIIIQEDFKSPGLGINVIENIEIAARTAGIIGANDVVVREYFVYMSRVLRQFTRCIAVETGKDFIDETIKKTLEEFTRKKDKKPLRRKNSSPINTDYGEHLDRGQKTNTDDKKIKTNDNG